MGATLIERQNYKSILRLSRFCVAVLQMLSSRNIFVQNLLTLIVNGSSEPGIKKALPALLRRGPSQKTDYATKIHVRTAILRIFIQ